MVTEVSVHGVTKTNYQICFDVTVDNEPWDDRSIPVGSGGSSSHNYKPHIDSFYMESAVWSNGQSYHGLCAGQVLSFLDKTLSVSLSSLHVILLEINPPKGLNIGDIVIL